MKVLIAADKFKGSLAAAEVAAAIRTGLLSIDPSISTEVVLMADGGEGTCELLTLFSNGEMRSTTVKDPLFRDIDASYGISGDGKTAFVEMAKASGLQLLSAGERNPTITTTYGTGQLIAAALSHHVKQIVLGIGGSATNDGGMGMAQALGFRFLSESNEPLKGTGENLIRVTEIDDSHKLRGLDAVRFTVIFDVNNPLYGERGAARIFARQKGADETQIASLDKGLRHFAEVVKKKYATDINFPGAGAAGGLGGGAKIFLNAVFSPGIDFVLSYVDLGSRMKDADLVITGEGKIDVQTLLGKVVHGVAAMAKANKKTCVAVAGRSELSGAQTAPLGLDQVITLMDESTTEADAIAHASMLLAKRIKEQLSARIKSMQN